MGVKPEEIQIRALIWHAGEQVPLRVLSVNSEAKTFKAISLGDFSESTFDFIEFDGDSEICPPAKAVAFLLEQFNIKIRELKSAREETVALEEERDNILSELVEMQASSRIS